MRSVLMWLMLVSAASAYWTFDTDNEGFVTSIMDETTPWPYNWDVSAQWLPTGGHPDGHIETNTTSGLNGRLYAVLQKSNTMAVLGDLSGKILQADFRRSGHFQSPDGTHSIAYWSIGDSEDPSGNWWVSKTPLSIDLDTLPADTWVQRSIEIKEENFMKWPNSANVKTFSQLMATHTIVGVTLMNDDNSTWTTYTAVGGVWRLLAYGAVSSDGAVLSIDNFRASSVPRPVPLHRSALVLLALLLAGFGASYRAMQGRRG